MGLSQREKGKRGEREWVDALKARGYSAHRSQQFKGTKDSADVLSGCPVGLWEVKRVQALSIHPVVQQARQEADGALCAVAWRKDGGRWIVCMDAEEFFRVLKGIE